MGERYDAEVLICGAGAAGLTLAIDLARRGIDFFLIDKLKQPFSGSRGKGIQPRSLEVYEDLGLVDHIVSRGGPYPPERKYAPDGQYRDVAISEAETPSPSEPYPNPLMLPQFLTEQALRNRLAELGGTVDYDVELTKLHQTPDAVIAHLRGRGRRRPVRIRYVVGADGGRSFVRQALGVGFPGETLGVRAIVADVRAPGLSRTVWHRWNSGESNQISLCPLAGTDLFQLQGPIPLEGEVDLTAQGLNRLLAARIGSGAPTMSEVLWASAFNMNARLADRYRIGRVFLAGDAAHIHPPTGGQGLNTSVQDAYNLGWKLAAVLDGAPQALLDTYEEERRPIAAEMLGMTKGLLDDAKAGRATRRGRETRQLDLGYLSSSLALEHPERDQGLAAGERAPDAPCRGAAGQLTRLFVEFRGPHWTLLAFGIDPATLVRPRFGLRLHGVGDGLDLIDADGALATLYSAQDGDVILIRPDGYIGAILTTKEPKLIEDYLLSVGLSKLSQ